MPEVRNTVDPSGLTVTPSAPRSPLAGVHAPLAPSRPSVPSELRQPIYVALRVRRDRAAHGVLRWANSSNASLDEDIGVGGVWRCVLEHERAARRFSSAGVLRTTKPDVWRGEHTRFRNGTRSRRWGRTVVPSAPLRGLRPGPSLRHRRQPEAPVRATAKPSHGCLRPVKRRFSGPRAWGSWDGSGRFLAPAGPCIAPARSLYTPFARVAGNSASIDRDNSRRRRFYA
jgi:hypothetical protein